MEFKFADVGEGISEGEIVLWHVEEGDRIEENETLVEVETDKAIVEIPSSCDGQIEELPFAEGEVVAVGETLAVIDADDEEGATVVGEIGSGTENLDEPEEASGSGTEKESVLATPKTRKLAEELDVDLAEVPGSGEEGRVTEEDVRQYAEDPDTGTGDSEDPHGPVEQVPLKGVRRRIAETTVKNHENVPQVTHMDAVDVTDLLDFVENHEEQEVRELNLTPFVLKALGGSLREHPDLNASFDGENERIVRKKYYNIGLTVDTESGLIVPVVRNVDGRDVRELAEETERLARRARNRELDLEEMKGATFTLSNVGVVGGRWSTPQVNAPEVAILATGEVCEEPAVRGGEVEVRRTLPLSLSFDHRVLDGADAARFVNDLGERLGEPENFALGS